MSDDEKRIKIAEACGWEQSHNDIHGKPTWLLNNNWQRGHTYAHELPDYFNDLNATHDMEKYFDDKKIFVWEQYKTNLEVICNLDDAVQATARQRAEAFIKTLEL